MKKEWQKRAGMAAAVGLTLLAGALLFCRHWRFELPLYPNVDEQLSLGCIYELLDQHLYAGDIYELDFFRYPHLTFYYAALGARILGKIFRGVDTVILLRYVICGTALLSNVCIYFIVKIMTGSRKWAYLGFLLSVFSLYGYAYLYYTGPDTLLYAVANVILLLGCLILREKDEERAVYLWYPLLAVCIGLAMAAKYHGVVFGLFWLALHIGKKYWKRHRNNYLFFLDCFVLAFTFAVCNYSLFFHFKTFVGDNLYNLSHYAWGHPGIEHNLPFLGYLEAFALSPYGVCGGILLLLGVVYLIRQKDWKTLVTLALMPLCIVILLSKYRIVLGRNLSLVLPFSCLFMTYGLMQAEAFLTKFLSGQQAAKRKFLAAAVTGILVLCNVVTVLGNYRYDLTYDYASSYIAEKIPAGAVLYCTSYAPVTDSEKYEIVEIGEDVSLLPDMLSANEYFIDVEYATGYFSQKKDYLLFKGGDLYPEKKALYEEKTAAYTLLDEWRGLSYGGEWKYQIGYFDLFLRSPQEYYVGPSIAVYGG
ncbi:MAG: glycosyltransferase family 39 protein [Bacteroidales bacterium]|nr:glycosyltransferase family 39 protein [Bacteroidales bacterium]MCM1415188.1 glycosyltransferase family 39 protein [bacterium]MCM1424893.1 glycosyltransferase family 39 protein [bacterium]